MENGIIRIIGFIFSTTQIPICRLCKYCINQYCYSWGEGALRPSLVMLFLNLSCIRPTDFVSGKTSPENIALIAGSGVLWVHRYVD